MEGIDEHGEIRDGARDEVMASLRAHFRPEFLNRLDEVIVFRKLTHDNMVSIVDLELNKLSKRMAEKDIELEVTQEAKDFLIEHGTDEKFGARPLRRAIEQYVEDPLSESMLRGEFAGKNRVVVTVQQPSAEGEKAKLKLESSTAEHDSAEPVGAGHGQGT